MDYIGEHLLPGKLGHFFTILSFAASFVAMIAFFKSAKASSPDEESSWRRMGRIAFRINVLSVFLILSTIIYIISARLFEYNFAWEHSSRSLTFKYLLACIWEAQEGSFLLWAIWNCVLGMILIRKAGKWEAPVMSVISFTQFCLASMLIGIFLFGSKIGLNPFILVRQQMSAAPIFSRADYLSFPQMQDGQGLNVLLQNYWMVIHPPILFLGIASTVVPFAYAIAGLMKRQYGEWTKIALPWTLFSACVLGTGILMGAAWAYESLSFGGYWAWDPVENASLVPWLVLVAGLHTQVIYNSTGHSLRATYFFLIMQFVFILYETFLTRSGILGDSSVHAFVDSGMNIQLALFVLVFFVPALILYGRRYRQIPHIVKEESPSSREFWMFIGSLVLFLSGLFIIAYTTLPVTKLFSQKELTIGDDDKLFAYNRIEIFVAILLGLFTAVSQYLKYKGTSIKPLLKKVGPPTVIALVLSVLINLFGGIHYDRYGAGFLTAIHFALFAALYAVVANAGYIWIGLKGRLRAAGGAVAHTGFGLMLAGILLSSAKKELLSHNTTGINLPFDPASKQDPLENITLLKGVRTNMGKYWATFVDADSVDTRSKTTFYHIALDKVDGSERFDLYPNMQKNTKGQQGGSPNPDKHHYWDRDIFAYITATDPGQEADDTVTFRNYPLAMHDTVYYSRGYLVLDTVLINPNNGKFHFSPSDTALVAGISVVSGDGMRYTANPVYFVKDDRPQFTNDTVFAQNLAIRFNRVLAGKKIELGVKESASMVPFIALKVLEFPQIGILWIGAIVMIIGFIMSILWRRRLAASRD
ncbi:MAG: cytochrome c biogenesis protein CcsA [Bacteroidota bacterium]|nr:cytochrome c biogenesis protein CcsA [Bacteroidota bacterium]